MNGTGVGDVLLHWVSERGSGKTRELQDGVLAAARSYGLYVDDFASWHWVRDAAALGAIDTDARTGRWSAAPPVLTRLPFADGTALLAGARPAAFEAILEKAATDWLDVSDVPTVPEKGRVPTPASLFVQYDDADRLPEAAERLGVRYIPCASAQLAAVLPRLEPGLSAAEPGRADECGLTRFDPGTGRFQSIAAVREDGLYRWLGGDRTRVFRLRRSGSFLATEREAGIYLELSHIGSNLLRWEAESGTGRQRVGRLLVDAHAPLPPLHARTAVLCSGLPPVTVERPGKATKALAYDNVPLAIAEAIATSLGQRLPLSAPAAAPSFAALTAFTSRSTK